MSFVIASQILLWIGLGALGLLVAALARQVGLLHQRIAPVGALSLPQSLSRGSQAPEMKLKALDGSQVTVGGSGRGKSQLLLFLSPECTVCATLLPAIRSAGDAERRWLELILASDGDLQKHVDFVRDKDLMKFPYVVSEQLGRVYGVSKLPYAVLIDESGRLVVAGLVNTREHLESLFVAKEQGVSSIQEFLNQRSQRVSSGA